MPERRIRLNILCEKEYADTNLEIDVLRPDHQRVDVQIDEQLQVQSIVVHEEEKQTGEDSIQIPQEFDEEKVERGVLEPPLMEESKAKEPFGETELELVFEKQEERIDIEVEVLCTDTASAPENPT